MPPKSNLPADVGRQLKLLDEALHQATEIASERLVNLDALSDWLWWVVHYASMSRAYVDIHRPPPAIEPGESSAAG